MEVIVGAGTEIFHKRELEMIPNKAKSQFQGIITHEIFEMERALDAVYSATVANHTTRGLGQSGPVLTALIQDATNSLKARGQFILGQLLRCMAAYHVTLDEETVTEASNLLREAIEREFQVIATRLYQKNRRSACLTSNKRNNSFKRSLLKRVRD